MTELNVLILAARASTGGGIEDYPAFLGEVEGETHLERLVEKVKRIGDVRFTFAFNESEIQRYHLGSVARLLADKVSVVGVPAKVKGAACTALYASSTMNERDELLIINVNQFIDSDFVEIMDSFHKRKLVAGVVTFESSHPRYSFVTLNEYGCVVEAAEKKPISKNATAGVFWFSTVAIFQGATKSSIRKDASVNDCYYVAPVLNEIILSGGAIGTYHIKRNEYHPLKNDKQISNYEAALELKHGEA